MQNENRLIEDFKYQTKPTIWKHLNTMAANYAVYSTRLNGYPPFLTDYDTYLYCTDTNMVIVCLDCCGHNEEQTYEESDTLSCLILEDGYEPRISMVWKLAEAVRLAKKRLENTAPHINVYGVLLTEADILNACDLYELWDKHDVTVIDELTRLKYKTIRVNEDDDLPCKKYVWTIIDATSTKSHKETIVEDNIDEFDRLLEKFLNDDMEVIDEDEPLDNANEDLPDDNEEDISSEEPKYKCQG